MQMELQCFILSAMIALAFNIMVTAGIVKNQKKFSIGIQIINMRLKDKK